MRIKVKSIQINIDDCVFDLVETERFKDRRRPFAHTCPDDARSHTSDEHSVDSNFIFKHYQRFSTDSARKTTDHSRISIVLIRRIALLRKAPPLQMGKFSL